MKEMSILWAVVVVEPLDHKISISLDPSFDPSDPNQQALCGLATKSRFQKKNYWDSISVK